MKQMKRVQILIMILIFPIALLSLVNSCSSNTKKNTDTTQATFEGQEIISEQVKYTAGEDTLIGYIFYDKNASDPRPGIIVVPEWWGNNDYPRMRAKQLAELGYTTFAIDMYGNGKVVDNPSDAQQNAGKIYSNPALLKGRMMAAYNTLAGNEKVDGDKIAAIGYCFGGSVSLNAASMGVPLDAVVSFHGGLEGFKASPDMKSIPVLICNGRADQMVKREHIQQFRDEMQKVDAHFVFREYDGATHAFTNPAATATGKKYNIPIAYNAQADKASWQDMLDFFDEHFPVK